MPAFEEKTYPYEMLFRFGNTEETKGKLVGANLKYETYVYRDGVFWQSAISEPQQLALVDGETGEMLADVLGEINAQTIIDNQVLTAANQSLSAELAAATSASQELGTELDQTRDHLTAAQAEIQRLTDLLSQSAAVAEPEQEEAQPAE